MATGISRPATPPPDEAPFRLESTRSQTVPIPNKHIPFCPPGPPVLDVATPSTPPDTPPSKDLAISGTSVLQSLHAFHRVVEDPPVYLIDGDVLEEAVEEVATRPVPDTSDVFPWLHGLHAENHMQLAFFAVRRANQREPPRCFRNLMIVKAGGDLSTARLKGAISPNEILSPAPRAESVFLDADPREGFSVRNFQIQIAKMATMSDIVIYRDHSVETAEAAALATRIASAQRNWKIKCGLEDGTTAPAYDTFILQETFEDFQASHPEMVAINANGELMEDCIDFARSERREMCAMGKATEIAPNVWLGPTPNTSLLQSDDGDDDTSYDLLIEASDLATAPDPSALNGVAAQSLSSPQYIDFPSSGSIIAQSSSDAEIDSLARMCRWMYKLANQTHDDSSDEESFDFDFDGDIPMRNLASSPRKMLLHCADGYTETTLLALAYLMYVEQIPVHEAWLRLHRDKQRNFFAYPSDVLLLRVLESRLMHTWSKNGKKARKEQSREVPAWLSKMDGSLPSRILPYLYLGSVNHANNPELLKEIGIRQILSIGEPVTWNASQTKAWSSKNGGNVLFIDGVQDNGVDPLIKEFERSLRFIQKGRDKGIATLVHCRVGVSRSATICIAEVMASMAMPFPEAYCFVRARRLNVIIQPHLRFVYELMKWDEICQQRRGERIHRDVDWATTCREIAAMNRPYCSKA